MEDIKLDLQQMKVDLYKGILQCSQRCLTHSAKWLSEIYFALSHIKVQPQVDETPLEADSEELEQYFLGKSYFELKEYDRCAYFTRNCTEPKCRFLYFYSKYFAIEKKKLDNMTDNNCPPDSVENEGLTSLLAELQGLDFENKLDGFCLYLYGVILKKLDIIPQAIEIFTKAVNSEPMLWCAWFELGKIVPNKHKMAISSVDHWMKYFFIAHAYLEQLNNDEALQIYLELCSKGLKKSTYVMAQIAIAHHNRRELMKAIDIFKQILKVDPFRLDNLDTYSNLLYVQEMKTELASLAHDVVLIDKYRVETCCIIGNYYGLRSDHAKAVLYFRRALKLNPNFLSAWTLMGHEYMEMKNTNAAIQSYRRAIEINKRDYRAWYGLGQTYEILRMYFYCLYYYKQAQQLKPNDSRMLIALGETYEQLEKNENALKCYYKACTVGDIEGQALIKLAKLYDKLKEYENAAAAFTEYCLREDGERGSYNDEQNEYYTALQYLANHHLKRGELDAAYTYAYKCLENDKSKDVARSLLKDIAARRLELDENNVVAMDETRISDGAEEDLEITNTSNFS